MASTMYWLSSALMGGSFEGNSAREQCRIILMALFEMAGMDLRVESDTLEGV